MTIKKKLENLTVEEQKEVRMEVELSRPSAEVRWMKNGVVLQPASNMELLVDGAKQSLVFKSVAYADRGLYSCETLDDKTQAKLSVESKMDSSLHVLLSRDPLPSMTNHRHSTRLCFTLTDLSPLNSQCISQDPRGCLFVY